MGKASSIRKSLIHALLAVTAAGFLASSAQAFFFPRPVTVPPRNVQDPGNSAAFPTELTFVQAGTFTGTQKALATPTGEEHGPSSGPTLSQAECRDLLLSRRDAGGIAAE